MGNNALSLWEKVTGDTWEDPDWTSGEEFWCQRSTARDWR